MLYSSAEKAHRALAADWRWRNFQIRELSCRCGGRFCDARYWHDPRFLDHLQALRAKVGRALVIRSGHRCTLWNAEIGGAPLSQHKRIAVDIALEGHDRRGLYTAAREIGFSGFGLARTFLHLDLRAQPAIWYYHGSKDLWTTSLE